MADDNQLLRGSPFASYQRLTVTFGATPGLDTVVRHSLKTADPESVEYIIVGLDRAGSVYHDQTATRKPWGADFLVLRASVASLKAELLLTVPRTT